MTVYPGVKIRVVTELSNFATLDASSLVEFVMYRRGNPFTTHGTTMTMVLTNADGKLEGNEPKSSIITIPGDGEIEVFGRFSFITPNSPPYSSVYEKKARSLKIQILRGSGTNWFNVFATSVPTSGTYSLPTTTIRVKKDDQIRLAPTTGISDSSRSGVYQSNTAIVAFRSAEDDPSLGVGIDYSNGTTITSQTSDYASGTEAVFDGTITSNKSGNEYGIKHIASSSTFVQLDSVGSDSQDVPFDVSVGDQCVLTQAYSIVNGLNTYTRKTGSGLYTMKFTDTIDEIGFGADHVPASATTLKAVEIGKGVASLVEYCFCGCAKLESVTIPATVKRIGGTSTFQDCTSLKSIKFMGDSTWTPAICTFKGLTAITKIDLSPVTSLTALGKNAIRDCPELTELDIRNITEFEGVGTIVDCAALAKITLSQNLTSTAFEKTAFRNIPSLKMINVMNWSGTKDDAITYKTNVISKIKNQYLKATYADITVCFYVGSDTSSEMKALISGL